MTYCCTSLLEFWFEFEGDEDADCEPLRVMVGERVFLRVVLRNVGNEPLCVEDAIAAVGGGEGFVGEPLVPEPEETRVPAAFVAAFVGL